MLKGYFQIRVERRSVHRQGAACVSTSGGVWVCVGCVKVWTCGMCVGEVWTCVCARRAHNDIVILRCNYDDAIMHSWCKGIEEMEEGEWGEEELRENGKRRRESGERSRENGERRRESGERSRENGERRRESGEGGGGEEEGEGEDGGEVDREGREEEREGTDREEVGGCCDGVGSRENDLLWLSISLLS